MKEVNRYICLALIVVLFILVVIVSIDFTIPNENTIKFLDFVAKLLIPIVTGIFGFFVFRMNKNFEHTIVLKTKVIDKRVECYSKVSDNLNDIYTYLIRVGDWKDKKPIDIIKAKRQLSKSMHISKPFWSEKVFSCYHNFISEVFETHTGHGEDAKIKADTEKYDDLDDNDKKMFTQIRTNKEVVSAKYALLEKAFSEDMGVII